MPAISSTSPMRPRVDGLQRLRILPQCAGEVGSDQAGRNAIDADIVLSPFDREIARKLNVGGFGDVVGADHGRALQAADRGDDNDGAIVALQHAGRGHLDQAKNRPEGRFADEFGVDGDEVRLFESSENCLEFILGGDDVHQIAFATY